MLEVAQIALTPGDWLFLGSLVAGQTASLGAMVWKVASRIQNIENKVDLLLTSEIANLKDRITRAESRLDSRS